MEFTPQELSGVLFYHTQNEDEEFKAGWEKTRQQTFYLINIQLDVYRDWETDRKSTRLNSSHITRSRMPSSA